MVDIHGYGNNSHAYCDGGPSVVWNPASGSEFAQPIVNVQGSQWSDPGPAYSFVGLTTHGSNAKGTVGGQGYETNNSTSGVGRYDRDGLNAEGRSL